MTRTGGSLLEVARRCSVSQSTVSRVLNKARHGRFSVSDEVRDRILRVANELNYRPSIAARNLAAAKTKLVAVLGLFHFNSDRVGPIERVISTISSTLDRAGYEICVQIVSARHRPFDPPPLRVDGVIAVDPVSERDLEELEQQNIPYVSIDGVVGPSGYQVLPDDAQGTFMALRHLVELGHSRIAYLDHPAEGEPHLSVATRRAAFAKAVKEIGFTTPKLKLAPLPPMAPWDSYYQPFLQEAIINGKATAVLAYSHFGALALMRRAHDMGLTVPKDFSLVCFNDEPVLQTAIPAITAIDLPSVAMGHAAAEFLLRDLGGEANGITKRSVRVAEKLVVRESTAPPAAVSR